MAPIVVLALLILPAGTVLAQTVFTNQVPTNENFSDSNGPYELGMTFSSTSAGGITAIRHWKAPDDSATHVGRIWDANGNQLAEVTFDDNTGSGWKQQALTTPLAIDADTTYVVSVNSGAGGDSGSFYPFGSDLPVTNGELTGSQGFFIGSPGSFPNVPAQFHYFRDVVFVATAGEVGELPVCIEGQKFVSVTGPDGPFVRNSVTDPNPDADASNPLIAYVPPENLNDLPMAFFGGEKVFYQFVITNCGTIDLFNVRLDDCADGRSDGDSGFLEGGANGNCVEDPRLIPFSPPRIVAEVLASGESVTVTSADFINDPISSVDICETFGRTCKPGEVAFDCRIDGIVRNDSEVEADADLNGNGLPDECENEPDGVCRNSTNPAFVFFDDLNLVQCKETEPGIDIEKVTNGNQADGANDAGVPVIPVGDTVTWRYRVTNTGNATFTRAEVLVTDEVLAQFNNGLVPEFIREVTTNPNFPSDGEDTTLSPGERWIYGAEALALNLEDPANADATEDGCNPDNVPGEDRPAYFNNGVVNVPGASDSDPSHYCNPPPDITVEKFTNGYDADAADGFPVPTPPPGPGFPGDVGGTQVPVVKIGDGITWTYVVTNTGGEALTNVTVTDSKGANVICPSDSLAPGASFTCTASGTGLDLADDPTSVEGCGSQGQGMTVPTYENLGTVVGFGATSGVEVTDEDPSHYCNPPDVLIKKFTNGHDGDDANGIPAGGQGDFTVGAPQVAEVPIDGDITWTYVVTNTSSETLSNIVVTDDRIGTISCPDTTLTPGASFTCTAIGTAEDLQPVGNAAGCGSGTGETRPTYENLGMVMATGNTTGVTVEDDDPSHYCNPLPPPPCGLTLEKGCEIPPPAPPSVGKCKGKLQQFTMIWDGANGTSVGSVPTNSAGGTVDNGEEVTFFGPFSNNDVIVNVGSGQSKFHVSCSDKDMDGDTATNDDQQQASLVGRDCGKFQGDGKGSSGINEWLLEGFVDKENAVLDCTVSADTGDSSCEFQAVAADCDFPIEKPDILTFRVSGGDCSASDNAQKPDKTECTGGFINPNQAVQVSVEGETAFTLQPGETFDVERGGDPEIELTQGSVTQFNKFHGSCSQPLQAGDKYGANELLLLDGNGLGTNVVYSYLVGNGGPGDLTGITVMDDQLGPVPGSPIDLAEGASDTLTATAFLTQTTTNTATAVASPTCATDSNQVVVTVSPPPPCDVSIAFKELKDDKIKWTLTNGPQSKATLETLTLVFPAAYGAIKEVKLDGNTFKADDSDTYPNGVPSGATIGPNDWTEEEVAKRQLDQGESETLEVKFTDKSKDFDSDDFTLTLTFEEGCNVGFNTP